MQFLMVAYNFLEKKASYIDTGAWSTKAIKEAKLFGEVDVLASSKDSNFNYIPKEYDIPTESDYLHITTNNTIFGTQFSGAPDTDCHVFADMSSDIFSRNIDYSKFSLIYAGAQKNIGPAGLTMVIIKKDLMELENENLPNILRYSKHSESDSMLNTPPTFAWYMAGKVFKWIKQSGGLEFFKEQNHLKASTLYNYIDNSDFYSNPVKIENRSIMNVPFILADNDLDSVFLKESEDNGLLNLKGHRSVGGMRASIYNAMPLEGINELVDFMKVFEAKYG